MSERLISQGLDYYKATMSQVEHRFHPETEVTFELKNRGSNKLSEYVTREELNERLETLRGGWSPEEIAYLASLQNQDGNEQFTEFYLDYLAENQLPKVLVDIDQSGDLAVRTTGPWPIVTFWETIVMSELNELYFENKLSSDVLDLADLYRDGDERLNEKIDRLKDHPEIKFADFGTRRRFSWAWQRHVVEKVAHELPDNFIGTSNIFLAHELGVKPIGTYAHELPMVYAALADKRGDSPLSGHNQVLRDWEAVYRGDLTTALTDTFTSEYFFEDMTREQAESWTSLRHDSGDPIEFGERVIDYYQELGIDPLDKTVVFSDGLDIDTIIELSNHFHGRIKVVFGWGTTLTNDLGIHANNFVMKAVEADGVGTVKLSDTEGKHTGKEKDVQRYLSEVSNHIGASALTLV